MNDKACLDKDLYWKLFKSTFIISAFTIGGGFVIISLLKAKFVDEYKWLDDKEALNLVAIAQSAPPLAPNSRRNLRSRLRICARVTRKLLSQDLKAVWVAR